MSLSPEDREWMKTEMKLAVSEGCTSKEEHEALSKRVGRLEKTVWTSQGAMAALLAWFKLSSHQ